MILFTVMFRTLFFYIYIAVVYRIMGKRELGQLSIFDLLVSLMIAEIVAISIDNHKDSIWHAVLPIALLTILQLVIAKLSLKNKKFRDFVDGNPVLIIENGKINYNEMKKQRYNLDDLYIQLRLKDIVDLADVEYAILEANGQLSVVEYKNNPQKVYPFPLILDGDIVEETIELLKLSEKDIMDFLLKENVALKEVFVMYMKKGHFSYILKQHTKKERTTN